MEKKEIKKINERFAKAAMYKGSVDLLMGEIVKNCNAYLNGLLKANNNSICLHEYDEDGFRLDDNSFCVPYDGGAHPEYASNCFSDVETVFLKDGNIYLETEDCEAYDIENIDDTTFYDLCEFIYEKIQPKLIHNSFKH